MSYEATLRTLLADLVDGRVYPDVPPDKATFPLVTYQQVGGVSLWFGERAMPGHKNARVQVNVWADTRLQANQIARAIEGRMCTGMLSSEPFGAAVALYEDSIKKYGTRQDFGFWFPDP